MNFDNIKQKMDDQNMESMVVPDKIKALKKSELPVQKLRRNMKMELMTQIFALFIFFVAGSFAHFTPLAKGLYYIMTFMIALISVAYLLRLGVFLKTTSNLSMNSKEAVMKTLHELDLTLAVYNTAVISASLVMPFVLFIWYRGHAGQEQEFMDMLTLNFSKNTLILYIIEYLGFAIFVYALTYGWAYLLYGKYRQKLKAVLELLKSN